MKHYQNMCTCNSIIVFWSKASLMYNLFVSKHVTEKKTRSFINQTCNDLIDRTTLTVKKKPPKTHSACSIKYQFQ